MGLFESTSLREPSHAFLSSADPFLHLTPPLRRELLSLRNESDPELRGEGLFSLAQRVERHGREDLAALLYQELCESAGPAQDRSRAALEVLQGRGELGARAEHWLRNFTRQATDPATLLAMGVAGSVYRVARLSALARLQGSPFGGAAARFAASLAGLSLEAPAFTLSAKFGSALMGRTQDWSRETLGRELAASYLTLGGLRGAGALGRIGLRGLPASLRSSPGLNLAVGQGSMLGGILLAHSLETRAGLRSEQSAGNALFDGLATLLQFQVAGRLSRATFGENFAAYEHRLDLRAEALTTQVPRGFENQAWSFALEPAFAGLPSEPAPRLQPRPLFSNVMQMSGNKEGPGQGPRPSDSEIHLASPGSAPNLSATEAFLQGIGNPEAGLRAFLASLPVAATASRVKGEDGQIRIVAANAPFLSLFGHGERELTQHPLTHFFNLGGVPIQPSRLWTILRGGVFKASRVNFQGGQGTQRVWVSGVVRGVYGEDFAFTFYEPRNEGEIEQPAVSAALKAFQNADGTRRLDLDPEGYLELRSSLELSLQVSNPDSPLIRQLRQNDLRLRIIEAEKAPLDSLALSLERGLGHLGRKSKFPADRRLSIEPSGRREISGGAIHFVNGPLGFGPSSETGRPSIPNPLEATPRTNSAADRRYPGIPRIPAGSLFEQVSKALRGIPDHAPTDPGKKPPR